MGMLSLKCMDFGKNKNNWNAVVEMVNSGNQWWTMESKCSWNKNLVFIWIWNAFFETVKNGNAVIYKKMNLLLHKYFTNLLQLIDLNLESMIDLFFLLSNFCLHYCCGMQFGFQLFTRTSVDIARFSKFFHYLLNVCFWKIVGVIYFLREQLKWLWLFCFIANWFVL